MEEPSEEVAKPAGVTNEFSSKQSEEKQETVQGRPEYIYLDFWERTLGDKACVLFYQLLRTLHAVVWFYFAPFLVIFLSYAVPYYLGDQVVSKPFDSSTFEGTTSLLDTVSFSSEPPVPLFVSFSSRSQV